MPDFICKAGTTCPTDVTIMVNEKEYKIESRAWLILSVLKYPNENPSVLKVIYDYFDEDLV